MVTIAIVDNEEKQIQMTSERIERYLKEKDTPFQISSFKNGFDFLEAKNGFDIVFMDIDRPGINGRETADKLRKKKKESKLIFVTNLPQYAIEGYKVEALDFIVKPRTYADFSLARKRALSSLDNEENNSFTLSIHGSLMKFKAKEVIYIERVRHDAHLHLTSGEEFVFRSSLSKIETLLSPSVFFKCNSGCILNLDKVKSLNGDTFIRENGDQIPISRSHRKDAMDRLIQFYGK